MLQKIASAIGFTEEEAKVILFLAALFTAGYIYYIATKPKPVPLSADYKLQDSLYFSSVAPLDSTGSEADNSDTTASFPSDTTSSFAEQKEEQKNEKKAAGIVNINTASVDELQKLPGVGKKTAEAILKLRGELGSFTSPQQLLSVKGIGEKKLTKMLPFITIQQQQ